MKELKIGEEIRIRCVGDDTAFGDCSKCIFKDENCDSLRKRCAEKYRIDRKSVHFEIVED